LAVLYWTANQALQPVIKTGDATLAEGKAVIAGQAVELEHEPLDQSMVTWMIGSSPRLVVEPREVVGWEGFIRGIGAAER
jgi:hypothetical protein